MAAASRGRIADAAVDEGDVGPLVPDPAQPEVVVRGRCRRTANCWLVTLFLVNEQLPVRQNVDERWLFQVELAAAAPDGRRCSSAATSPCRTSGAAPIPELRHLDLLYREKVEFAVGHGVAVHAEVPRTIRTGRRRCARR